MAVDWIADVKKYAPKADDAVLEKMLSTYKLALSKPDAAYVSFSDPDELKTVRENFLKKKLGLSEYQMAALVWVKGLVIGLLLGCFLF